MFGRCALHLLAGLPSMVAMLALATSDRKSKKKKKNNVALCVTVDHAESIQWTNAPFSQGFFSISLVFSEKIVDK